MIWERQQRHERELAEIREVVDRTEPALAEFLHQLTEAGFSPQVEGLRRGDEWWATDNLRKNPLRPLITPAPDSFRFTKKFRNKRV